jgi:hypothetical protein
VALFILIASQWGFKTRAETIYFQMAPEPLASSLRKRYFDPASYPRYHTNQVQQAREAVKLYNEHPGGEVDLPWVAIHSVSGADGINRDYFSQNLRSWSWHNDKVVVIKLPLTEGYYLFGLPPTLISIGQNDGPGLRLSSNLPGHMRCRFKF